MTLHMLEALLKQISPIVRLFNPVASDGGGSTPINWSQVAHTRSLAAKYRRQ